MPVMKEVVKTMTGEKESKKPNSISLSNSSVKRRITNMSDDVLEQILTHVKESPFFPFSWMNRQILHVCSIYFVLNSNDYISQIILKYSTRRWRK